LNRRSLHVFGRASHVWLKNKRVQIVRRWSRAEGGELSQVNNLEYPHVISLCRNLLPSLLFFRRKAFVVVLNGVRFCHLLEYIIRNVVPRNYWDIIKEP
jgi:hypothetical protein